MQEVKHQVHHCHADALVLRLYYKEMRWRSQRGPLWLSSLQGKRHLSNVNVLIKVLLLGGLIKVSQGLFEIGD